MCPHVAGVVIQFVRDGGEVNGIIVTASIAELTGNRPEFAINLAKNLRQRVQELTEKLEEKLGDKVSPELKDALKGLFKR